MKLHISEEVIIFSPHFDDAILSMGAFMAGLAVRDTGSITLFNVFTKGSPIKNDLTRKLVNQGGFNSASKYFEARRIEDQRALEVVGGGKIQVNNLGFIDAPWRTGKNGQVLYPNSTWGVGRADDESLIRKLTEKMKDTVKKAGRASVFAPVGRGKGHIDHLIVRDAVRMVFDEVIYYSDFDYGVEYPIHNRFTSENQLQAVSEEGFGDHSKKMKAVLCYKTQLKGLFGDEIPRYLNAETFYTKT